MRVSQTVSKLIVLTRRRSDETTTVVRGVGFLVCDF
jgi:hypothetical protein